MSLLKRMLHPVKVVISPSYREYTSFIEELPALFALPAADASSRGGKVMGKYRNELREFELGGRSFVVKSFQLPNFINKCAYGVFRSSKAQRSYEYASMLNSLGIPSPDAVAYITRRKFLLFADSYYVSLKSACRFEYRDWALGKYTPRSEEMLRGVARIMALMHDNGIIHKDMSMGNILYDFFDSECAEPTDTGSKLRMEIIDLNRLRFHKIGIKEGCDNFDRLVAGPTEAAIVADEYIRARKIPAKQADRAWQLIVAAMGRARL